MKNILFTLALLISFNSFGQTEEVIKYYKSGAVKFKVNLSSNHLQQLTSQTVILTNNVIQDAIKS